MNRENTMTRKDNILQEKYYRYFGISSDKKKNRVFNLLKCCKEIRDTAYPLKDSSVTELRIVEFTAHKEKDLVYVNGSLALMDGDREENRIFDAYIMDANGEATVFLDITRVLVQDEPKMIRTTDKITEDEKNFISVTTYAGLEATEKKCFSSEFPKEVAEEPYVEGNLKQLSAF